MSVIYYEGFFRIYLMILWAFLQVAILDGMTMGCGSGISLPGMFRVVTDKTVRYFFRYSLNYANLTPAQ